jgi:acyl transferase domain-containing protein
MLLEVVWESLEDAAVNPHSLHNTKAGIFTGTWLSDYKDVMMKHGNYQDLFRTYMGNGFGATAGRLAHFLGTTGPNIATESGCSSSMVAVGMGMKNLRSGSTNLAICCGVNLMIHPFGSTSLSITSPNGRSKTFDADADGFGRGEGCGVLVLKRLQDAVRDNDRIYALLQGYGEGQEGPSSSMGTPTVAIEALAMQNALNDAATESWEVSYLESHGTGTPVNLTQLRIVLEINVANFDILSKGWRSPRI